MNHSNARLLALIVTLAASAPLAAKTLSSGAALRTAVDRVSGLANADDVMARIEGLCRSLRPTQTEAEAEYCRAALLKTIGPLIAPPVTP